MLISGTATAFLFIFLQEIGATFDKRGVPCGTRVLRDIWTQSA
jgi:hypothetical protein